MASYNKNKAKKKRNYLKNNQKNTKLIKNNPKNKQVKKNGKNLDISWGSN